MTKISKHKLQRLIRVIRTSPLNREEAGLLEIFLRRDRDGLLSLKAEEAVEELLMINDFLEEQLEKDIPGYRAKKLIRSESKNKSLLRRIT